MNFNSHDLDVVHELGIYRADDDTLVYGNYIEATQKQTIITADAAQFAYVFRRKEFCRVLSQRSKVT